MYLQCKLINLFLFYQEVYNAIRYNYHSICYCME
nr:MAG TPA: hypothetical protein [Caudoviricetes sp.]